MSSVVVDDVHRHFDGGLGVDAGAGGVAAQGENSADLDGLLRDRSAGQRKRHGGGRNQPEHMPEIHVMVSKGYALALGLLNLGLLEKPAARCVAVFVFLFLVAQALHARGRPSSFGVKRFQLVVAAVSAQAHVSPRSGAAPRSPARCDRRTGCSRRHFGPRTETGSQTTKMPPLPRLPRTGSSG
ncbi:MAG: hypothetical protein U1E61_07350 [Bradyrhizobium sp.]